MRCGLCAIDRLEPSHPMRDRSIEVESVTVYFYASPFYTHKKGAFPN